MVSLSLIIESEKNVSFFGLPIQIFKLAPPENLITLSTANFTIYFESSNSSEAVPLLRLEHLLAQYLQPQVLLLQLDPLRP